MDREKQIWLQDHWPFWGSHLANAAQSNIAGWMNTVLNQHSRLSTLQDFCPEVNASCQKSKPVCKFERFHRKSCSVLWSKTYIFNYRQWFCAIQRYQTIFWANFFNTFYFRLSSVCVFGTTWKSCNAWSSDAQFFLSNHLQHRQVLKT